MTGFEHLDAFIADIDAVADLNALKGRLNQEIRRLGFERFAYTQVRAPRNAQRRLYLGTYPAAWEVLYREGELQIHDPLAYAPFDTLQPFLWDEARQRAEEPKVVERLIFGPASDVGLRSGACIPIHGPSDAIAGLYVSNDCASQVFEKLFLEQRYELQLIAYSAHERILKLTVPIIRTLEKPLTHREREVLLGVVRRLTTSEIGIMLNIKSDTVRQHLIKIYRKLGVHNRYQAIHVAEELELVIP